MSKIAILEHNRAAWNKAARERSRGATVPVTDEQISAARHGVWELHVSPKPVPRSWLPNLNGCEVLCLAGGGGQQGCILAAAGANVTTFDLSDEQLASDRSVAERHNLSLRTVQGDMANLVHFEDESFGLVVHPISNLFVPDVYRVWAEVYRVLRPGGGLIAAFMNPVNYIFDRSLADRTDVLNVRYALPYADSIDLPDEERARYLQEAIPFEYSHSLEAQIGGQTAAGFAITGLYEDRHVDEERDPMAKYMPTFIVTHAIKC
jgi:ubiquinone/menaquinone biosynthesis C-methylase UbiE